MNFNNFTIKAQEAIQKASEIAKGNQQQAIETAHLLKGLLTVDENVVSYVLKKLNVNLNSLDQNITAAIDKLPKVSGGEAYLSGSANNALQKAQSYLKEFKDDFVSVEHLLLGILGANDGTAKLLKEQGVNEKDLKKAIIALRGDNRVTDQNAEATYQALSKYARNLNEYAESGKLDPVIGRDEEIRRVIQILSRRTKNNPILIGEPGVGKTAIAEGIAFRIIKGDVPENLKSKLHFVDGYYKAVEGADFLAILTEWTEFRTPDFARIKSSLKEPVIFDGRNLYDLEDIKSAGFYYNSIGRKTITIS